MRPIWQRLRPITLDRRPRSCTAIVPFVPQADKELLRYKLANWRLKDAFTRVGQALHYGVRALSNEGSFAQEAASGLRLSSPTHEDFENFFFGAGAEQESAAYDIMLSMNSDLRYLAYVCANRVDDPVTLRTLRIIVERVLGPCRSVSEARAALRARFYMLHPDKNSLPIVEDFPSADDNMRTMLTSLNLVLAEPLYQQTLFAPDRLTYGQLLWQDALSVGCVCGAMAGLAVWALPGVCLAGYYATLTALMSVSALSHLLGMFQGCKSSPLHHWVWLLLNQPMLQRQRARSAAPP